jgi:hypothetical protein
MIGECSDWNEGGNNYSPRAVVVQSETLGKGGVAAVAASVVLSALAIAVALLAASKADLAEREARIAQDNYMQLAREIGGSTDGH